MGCAELNNPRRTGASQNKIKDRNKRVHGEAWSSRLLARASSPPSPSLNGESDGYWLFFHPQASSSRLITQPFVLRDGGGQSCDNLNVQRMCCFAGSLGISRQMEGLVSEVSIKTWAGKDSAPSWPHAQLQHVSLALFGSRTLPRFFTAVVRRNTAYCVSGGLWPVVRAGNRPSRSPMECLKVLRSFSNGPVRRASLAAT